MSNLRFKFRAWYKPNNEMFTEKGIEFKDGTVFWPTIWFNGTFVAMSLEGSNAGVDDDDIVIMQSTGLKDRNGVSIWEGDLYRIVGSHANSKIYQVFFINGAFVGGINAKETAPLGWDADDDIEDMIESDWFNDSLEVIGNVYEHPELLTHVNE